MTGPEPKICASCGRTINWRKKWAKNWDEVRYCSQACRRAKLSPTDRQLERTILDLLEQRSRDSTICPSEAARAIGGTRWRSLMEPARAAARRLVASGAVTITQGGRVVDPSTAKGPLRIRKSGNAALGE